MTKNIVPQWLLKRADLTPNKIAFYAQEQTITFRELADRAIHLAQKIDQMIKPTDRVGLLLNNNIKGIEVIHSLQLTRNIMIFLNVRLTVSELSQQIEDADTDALIMDDQYAEYISELSRITPQIKIYLMSQLEQLDANQELLIKQEVNLSDIHSLIFTAGTSGKPKAVQLSYGNHWWSALSSSLNIGTYGDDKWLLCLPIYHVSGLSILMRQVILGISVVIEEFEGNKIAHLIDSQHITIVSLVSVMLKRILSAQANLSSLRCILLGGGSASQELFAEAKKRHLPLYFSYGMTETASQFATISSNEIERKFGSVGKPLFPNQLKIISQSKVCDRGEVGEILIKGPTLMVGYYFKNGEVTSFEDGWFNTGDLGYLDEEGFLYIVSRRFDLIISGGENVYPAEIEDVILNHAAVSDCGVIGIEDDEWGQAPVACIVTVIADEQKNNLRQELFQLCQNKLARFKQPKHIFFFEQLPRNTALKLLYHQLQEQVRTMIDA